MLKKPMHVVQADNLKAPSAVNAGRLCGKEEFYMKKAVKKYIDHCRWKETSEVQENTDDEDEDKSMVEKKGESEEEEEELVEEDFALSDEDEVSREARLERKTQRQEIAEFEARAAQLSINQKRNQEFKDER